MVPLALQTPQTTRFCEVYEVNLILRGSNTTPDPQTSDNNCSQVLLTQVSSPVAEILTDDQNNSINTENRN